MESNRALNSIRTPIGTTKEHKLRSIVYALVLGIIMGAAAKLVDNASINPIFDNIGGRLGIWVFTATLLSVFSCSPKWAAANVFAFFVSMLAVYYVYTTLFLNFFPGRAILFWGICALISPVCAYVMWYARGKGFISAAIMSLPVTVLLAEGYELRNAYLPIHTHYYLIPWLYAIYILMVVILLVAILKNKTNLLVGLSLAMILCWICVQWNVLGRMFGGMNGVL